MEAFFCPYECDYNLPGNRVGVLAPHPDDETFGAGGSLGLWQKYGIVISVAVVSDGLGWGNQNGLEQTRQNESLAACKLLKLPAPEFWQMPDGELLFQSDLVERIMFWIKNNDLDVILIPSIWEMHRDHRACAQAALKAAQNTMGLNSVWMYEVGQPLVPNRLIDISETFDLKRQAMRCYKSQLEMQNYFEQICGLNTYRTYTLARTIVAAEAFHVLRHDEIETFLTKYKPDELTTSLMSAKEKMLFEKDYSLKNLTDTKVNVKTNKFFLRSLKRLLSKPSDSH